LQTHLEAQQNLETLQSNMEEMTITRELLEKEATLHQVLHSACRLEEDYWRQKSRSLWLQVGDQNTSFFHKQVEARKQFKTVTEIQAQGQPISDFDKIKEEVVRHFSSIFF
jgi:hypothetical protein